MSMRHAVAFGSAAVLVGLLSVGSARPAQDEKFGGRLDPFKGGPNPLRAQPRLEACWDNLLRDEPDATAAVLELYAELPGEAVKLFAEKLRPLKADKKQMEKWIADLASEKDDVWKPAYEALRAVTPVVVYGDPRDAMKLAVTPLARRRLAGAMIDVDDWYAWGLADATLELTRVESSGVLNFEAKNFSSGGEFQDCFIFVEHRIPEIKRPTWTRMLRAVALLERLATGDRKADALAILKKLAEGHPDAPPTKRAKLAHHRLTAPLP